MNVLSLFDGMSCGQIALERIGINVSEYYASEIDKNAIKIAQKNYPNTKQIGSVLDVSFFGMPKIDLLIGGSPCQGFSFAGKGLNFEDPRSKLFFEYVRVLNELKPKYFLLENVKMSKESEDIISEYLDVKPIKINSSLVSAQNRKILYWTNIPNIKEIDDKEIILDDIIDKSIPFNQDKEKYSYNKKDFKKDSLCHHVGTANFKGGQILKRVYSISGKCPTLTTISGGCQQKKISDGKGRWRELTPNEYELLQTVPLDYTKGVANSHRYTMLGNGWTVDIIAHIFKGLK